MDPRGKSILERAARAHAGFLRARLRSLGVEEARLDDAAQDVLEVLARRIDAYDRRFTVRQWMAGVARNVARRYRRHAVREPDALEAEPAGLDDLERTALRREAVEALAQFLAELDGDRWAVFVLSEIEGLRGTEIAAELGVKLSTVYARLRSTQRAFDRALARRRARERRWAWVGLPLWRPMMSFGAVSSRLLAAIVVAMVGVGVTMWVVAGRRETAVEQVTQPEREASPAGARSRAEAAPPRSDDDDGDPIPSPPSTRRRDESRTALVISDAQRDAIGAFAALYRDFDDDRCLALFDVEDEPSVLREHLAWFTQVVGECGPPEPIEVVDDTVARFVFPCETGELEAAIKLVDADTPRMNALSSAVRGVDPPETVLSAARRALALYHHFDAAVVLTLFADDWDAVALEAALAEARANNGACTLGDVDLAWRRGAHFELDCEAGARVMKVDLAADERIASLFFSDPAP